MPLAKRYPWFMQPPAGTPIDWSNPLCRGLRLAMTANSGLINLANGSKALNAGVIPITIGTTGRRFDPGGSAAAEFEPNGLDAGGGNSLTLLSIWRASDTQYTFSDGTRVLASVRSAGNAGWTWGRSGAAAGGSGGNVTAQYFVVQGVAAYTEANSTIESLVDTVVAIRATGTNLSFWRNGSKSSADQTIGTWGAAGNLVFCASGPYSSAASYWKDRAPLLLGWNRPLSDFEMAAVMANPWQIFQP